MAKKKRKRKSAIVPVVYVVCGLLACVLVFKAFNFAFGAGKGIMNKSPSTQQENKGEEVKITIPQGASTKKIADILKENDLIDSVLMFRLNSKMGNYDGTYHHGDYLVARGTPQEDIMKLLQSGVVYADMVKLTIPEGYTAQQIADAVELAGFTTAEEFLTEMNTGEFDYAFLKAVPKRENYLEGYLFPATYNFGEEATAHEIIVKLLDRFEASYEDVLKNSESSYSVDELVIIASLIESEIQVAQERPVAAGVIYNRLEKGMPLQIDSTVQYALSTRNEVVTNKDLDVDSPYNTYKNKGLPPGPICNPGDAALEAAANPQENRFLYYVVKERGSGAHVFTETYDEFLNAKQAYKNSFN